MVTVVDSQSSVEDEVGGLLVLVLVVLLLGGGVSVDVTQPVA